MLWPIDVRGASSSKMFPALKVTCFRGPSRKPEMNLLVQIGEEGTNFAAAFLAYKVVQPVRVMVTIATVRESNSFHLTLYSFCYHDAQSG
jgi:hypothetical protein